MAHTVTPNRTHSFCDKRLRDANGCWCHRAQYSGRCQSCHKQISLGDCIQSNISGWVHVKCPIGNGSERGVRTIEDGFNNNVDYGSSFLKRLTMMDGEQRSMPSPLRLTFNDEQEDDTKMPAKASKEKKRRHIEITQESDEERELGDEDNELDDDDNQEGCSNKRAKHEEDAILAELIDNPQGNYADQMRTDEQMAILSHEPERGDVVVVNALAGCGKTTTIALLCNKILTEHPDSKCLYLVYNTEAGEEAMQSNKFPKDNMEIRTTHAYVLRHLFSVENMFKVQPTGDYSIDNIIECLDLRRECREIFKKTLLHVGGERKLEKRVKVIAGYIRNTIKNYQASADATLNRNHVFWRAKNRSDLTSRTMWRKKVSVSKYVHWASEVFSRVSEECMNIRNGGRNSGIDIPHDAYLKVAQVENLVIPFDVLCIDEAQDMTACQADLFWGLHQRSDKIIYLFGDRYQQIYRFRGASRSFRDMVDESNPKFTLTGTFRFGKNIANCASCVLRSLGGSPLHGRSTDDGRVILVEDDDDGEEEEDTAMHRGVVLCRSQNGIFRYLYTHSPDRWCYLSGGISNIQDPKQWQLDLEEFVQGNRTTFTHKGETFESIPGIKDYIDDEGDIDLYRTLTLLQFLVAQGKSIQEFFSDLRASYFPLQSTKQKGSNLKMCSYTTISPGKPLCLLSLMKQNTVMRPTFCMLRSQGASTIST